MHAQHTTTRESKTVTVTLSAEISVDASAPVEAQIKLRPIEEDGNKGNNAASTKLDDGSSRGSADVRVADFVFGSNQNGRSGDDTA